MTNRFKPILPDLKRVYQRKRSAANSLYGWWFSNYEVPKLNNMGFLGERCTVAILDTGITPIDRIQNRVVEFTNYTGENFLHDNNGHGTFVANLIGGWHKDGYKSAMPQCEILSKRVLGTDGFGDNRWIRNAYADLLNFPMEKGRFYFVNASLGGWYDKQTHDIIKQLLSIGWLPFAAAGNFAEQGMGYPAASREGISVGATTIDEQLAIFSSRPIEGQDLDICLGGDGISSYDHNGNLVTGSGTSFSCPNMVGAYGLLKEYDYSLHKRLFSFPSWEVEESVIEDMTGPIVGEDSAVYKLFQPAKMIEFIEAEETVIPDPIEEPVDTIIIDAPEEPTDTIIIDVPIDAPIEDERDDRKIDTSLLFIGGFIIVAVLMSIIFKNNRDENNNENDAPSNDDNVTRLRKGRTKN